MYTGIRVVAMPNKTNVHINDLIKACMKTKWLNVSISFLFTTVFLHDHDFDLMVILLNLSFFRSAQWCWPKPKVKSLKLIGEVTMSDRNLSKNEWEGEKTIEIGGWTQLAARGNEEAEGTGDNELGIDPTASAVSLNPYAVIATYYLLVMNCCIMYSSAPLHFKEYYC